MSLARKRVTPTKAEILDGLRLMIMEIEARPFDRGSTFLWKGQAAMYKGALTLIAAAGDGMSNDERVGRVETALRVLKGEGLPEDKG